MFTRRNVERAMPADAVASAGGGTQDYGGFWIRFLAYLADWAILTLVLVVLFIPFAFMGAIGAALYGAICVLGPIVYFAVMQASPRQATFGKDLLGLKVANGANFERLSFVRSLLRELAKILSGMILALGFIMAAFTRRKQGLHDMLAGTVVTRERSPRVVAAIVLIVAGIAIPLVALPLMAGLFMGGVMLAVVGPILGGMMGGKDVGDAGKAARPVPRVAQPAAKAPPRRPAPPRQPAAPSTTARAPAAGAAMNEAEYDKQLARALAGIDKPSSARAGPAIVHLDTHFGDSFWLKVLMPGVTNLDRGRASVTIDRVLDARGADRYDRASNFEKEFFRNVRLSASRTGVPHYSGTRSVRVTKGTSQNDVQKVEGKLHLSLPLGLTLVSFGAADAGRELAAGPVKIALKSFDGDKASFSVSGAPENFLGATGYDANGAVVPASSTSRGGDQYTVNFRAPVARVEMATASGLLKREYPFTVARGGTAAAASAPAATTAPAKPVVVAVAPAMPAKAEVKPLPPKALAVEKPAAAKPKAPPAAAPRMKAESAAPAPAAATRPTPRPARVRMRIPAAPAAVAAPPPPVKTPRYNDVMTAVMMRDPAGAVEGIAAGFWVDRSDSNGVTPLMAAAMLGDAAMVQLLLRHGANPNRNAAGGSVLDFAGRSGDAKVVQLLKQAGAK